MVSDKVFIFHIYISWGKTLSLVPKSMSSVKVKVKHILFLQLRDWLHDKMAAAEDETYRDAKNLHSKYLRHQAFEREIAANKDRLLRLQQVAIVSLLQYKPWI